MQLADLEQSEREIIRQCLNAAVHGPFFPDWEFHALFGLERGEVKYVLDVWPGLDDSKKEVRSAVRSAINNSLNNLLGYPHGCEKEWSLFISVSRSEVERIFKKWRGSV